MWEFEFFSASGRSVEFRRAKYEQTLENNAYKLHMKLTIRSVNPGDYGSYKCVSKNSLGETDGTIKLYHIPSPSTEKTTSSTTPSTVKLVLEKAVGKQRTRLKELSPGQNSNEISEPAVTEKEKDLRLRSNPSGESDEEKLSNINDYPLRSSRGGTFSPFPGTLFLWTTLFMLGIFKASLCFTVNII
ncbi:hypothetical protein HHI36_011790 [Cryptolaemus montrouzieri]|uniref:Immunoglobulin I-set domain-containing protein n=1 Tax=Cryptolaemus montrouzieri TaxID=559131 RepID=A0ABD2NCL3_9CUCU